MLLGVGLVGSFPVKFRSGRRTIAWSSRGTLGGISMRLFQGRDLGEVG